MVTGGHSSADTPAGKKIVSERVAPSLKWITDQFCQSVIFVLYGVGELVRCRGTWMVFDSPGRIWIRTIGLIGSSLAWASNQIYWMGPRKKSWTFEILSASAIELKVKTTDTCLPQLLTPICMLWYSFHICKNRQVVIMAPIKRPLSIKNTSPSQKSTYFCRNKPRADLHFLTACARIFKITGCGC